MTYRTLALCGLGFGCALAARQLIGSDAVAMPAVNTLHPVNLQYEADVVECFIRIKQGADIEELRHQAMDAEEKIERLNDQCIHLGTQLQGGNESKAAPFLRCQSDRHKARLELARVNEQIDLYAEHHQDQALIVKELESILCLPQVIAVRAESPSVIVFTVRATIAHQGVVYHLSTWDVFFGDVASIKKGTGDRDCYRVKCVVNGLTRKANVSDFHHWTDGSFCFGTNYNRVEDYARRGEFLHGMQAIILYLSTIQSGKRQQIPKMFRQLNSGVFV